MSWARFLCETNCKSHPKECISENLLLDMAERLELDGYKVIIFKEMEGKGINILL